MIFDLSRGKTRDLNNERKWFVFGLTLRGREIFSYKHTFR